MIIAIQTQAERRKEWMFNVFGQAGKANSNYKDFQVWKQDYHAVQLYSNKFISEKLLYIHLNPVRAGIVEQPEDYMFSSARNYADLEGMLDIVLLSRTLNE